VGHGLGKNFINGFKVFIQRITFGQLPLVKQFEDCVPGSQTQPTFLNLAKFIFKFLQFYLLPWGKLVQLLLVCDCTNVQADPSPLELGS
jgi:hypothetical protein